MSDPWFKFYPTDWRADPALRMCSPAARGVWIDLICIMHEATPYGHLLINGHCPTDAQVAVLTGTPPEQLSQCLRELESAGVFSRTKDGTIYSRKMTRMVKKAATARNNGRKGGNPTLLKQRENPASDNLQDKGRVKPQKLEARSQKEERNPLTPFDYLAGVASPDVARDFIEHRQAMKKPLTPLAAKKMAEKLRKHPEPDAVLNHTIENGWQGIFPEKVQAKSSAANYGAFGKGEMIR